jgi:Protein of unknown function (DUF2797)
MKMTGILSKMETLYGNPVKYQLELNQVPFDLTSLLGKNLKVAHSGKIICSNCSKEIKKSYAEGFCYPCTMKLASCDLCILKPETCHYSKGTCREPQWALEHCFKPHVIYLANSSGLKVGITRKSNIPYRWIDQGATEALPIMEVENRLISGQIEVLFKKHIADKTDWRKMLKGEASPIDLVDWKNRLIRELAPDLEFFEFNILEGPVVRISYPVLQYPEKITSFNLDKVKEITGKLTGIKGQYLIFDTGVFNVRSHSGYEITLEEVHATATA